MKSGIKNEDQRVGMGSLRGFKAVYFLHSIHNHNLCAKPVLYNIEYNIQPIREGLRIIIISGKLFFFFSSVTLKFSAQTLHAKPDRVC